MSENRYQIKTACPQCGCSAVSNLTETEMKEKFGDVPNVEMECTQCMKTYHEKMEKACPEWDTACRMKNA